MEIKLDLTKQETEILDNYFFKKIINLENSNLRETPCYALFTKLHRELNKNLNIDKNIC